MRRMLGAVLAPSLTLAVLSSSVVGLAACSGAGAGSSGGAPGASSAPPVAASSPLPDVVAIAPAVAALETVLGGVQRYFEINAETTVVHLFVAVAGADGAPPHAVSYSYLGSTLSPVPTDLGEATGPTLTAAELTFDPAKVLQGARAALPTTNLTRFVVIGGPDGPAYSIDAQSASGGRLRVDVAIDGSVVDVVPVS